TNPKFMKSLHFTNTWRLIHRSISMSLMMLGCIIMLPIENTLAAVQAQQSVNGTVLDENGKPLAGVTVSLENATVSTLTADDGSFSIRLATPTGTLLFTAVGYLVYPLAVKAKDQVTVSLQVDEQQMDEAVVIGYGTVRTRALTGSVTSVTSEDTVPSPAHNPLEAIQGQVPALHSTLTSG